MNAKIKLTYRDKNGNIIVNPTDGELAYSPETSRLYKWSAAAGDWELVNGDVNLGMTTYDLNKQIIAQMGVLDEEGMEKARNSLTNLVMDTNQRYYMLLCRDINYYTLFYVYKDLVIPPDLNHFAYEVIDCIHDIGAIKSVEPVPGDALEIWAHPVIGDPVAMYLFPYDAGVVECVL